MVRPREVHLGDDGEPPRRALALRLIQATRAKASETEGCARTPRVSRYKELAGVMWVMMNFAPACKVTDGENEGRRRGRRRGQALKRKERRFPVSPAPG